MDWPIRIALSVGISLGVVGIVSWILNDLYPLNEGLFGVRSDRVVLIIYILTVFSAGGAIIRRSRLDPEMQEKFALPRIRLFENDPKDIIITSVLILILIGAIGYGVYLRQYHHPASDRYTELYILGPDEKIEGYPNIIEVDESRMLHLGLANHEFETRDYFVIISLDYQGVERTIKNLNDLQMNRSVKYVFSTTLEHGQRFQEPLTFFMDTQGQYLFSVMILDKDGSKYREVKLDITVLDPDNMIRGEGIIMFLADQFGVPSYLSDTLWNENILSFQLVIVNDRTYPFPANVTLTIGDRIYLVMIEPFTVYSMNLSTSLFSYINIPSHDTGTYNFLITLPRGTWDLAIQVNRLNSMTFVQTITVT